LINATPFDGSFQVHPDASISRSTLIKGHLTMGEGARIEPRTKIQGSVDLARQVRVGDDSVLRGNVSVGPWTNMSSGAKIIGEAEIGGFCACAQDITIRQRNHPTSGPVIQGRFYSEVADEPQEIDTHGPITVGNDVWLCEDVTILSGVTIGDGAVVGADSVVTKDVEPYEIVAGVPAEHRGWRFDESVREQLLDIAWWEWDEDRLRRNRDFFRANLRETDDIYSLVD
jgi:virginiamycin A acetyltransferase